MYKRAFISKTLPETAGPQTIETTASTPTPFIDNLTFFALGILLIEIRLSAPLDIFRTPDDPLDRDGKPDVCTKYATAIRLLKSDRILEEAGPRYVSAVRRCIKCNFNLRNTDLEDDEFRQAVFDGVVASLEDEVRDSHRPL